VLTTRTVGYCSLRTNREQEWSAGRGFSPKTHPRFRTQNLDRRGPSASKLSRFASGIGIRFQHFSAPAAAIAVAIRDCSKLFGAIGALLLAAAICLALAVSSLKHPPLSFRASAIREERQKDFALEIFDGYALSPAIASQRYTASAVEQSPGLMLDAVLVRLAGA
jgi:hypothetical protein